LVSIILLNWNNSEDTIRCINSLKRLTYQHYNIIVVDNGSEDDSITVLNERFPGITIIQSPDNKGFTGGNNIGINHAMDSGADMVWILNRV